MIFKRAALAAIGLGAVAMPALAQQEGAWLIIAELPATSAAAPLTVDVPRAYVSREVQFCVEGHALRLLDANVTFHDGQSQAVPLRTTVRARACSRAYSLRGTNREIASLSVTYDGAALASATATVQILAR